MPSDDYVERVNAAIDYIVTRLDQPLRLEDIAQVACFSPFHFHRVFSSIIGETLGEFVKRLRLERALQIMSHDKSRSLTNVALDCGFSSSSDFSRSFKQRFGVPPSAFDLDTWRASMRDQITNLVHDADGRPQLQQLPVGTNPDEFSVTIRQLPARTVAYIRVLDPFHGGVVEAVQRLQAWAEKHNIIDNQWFGYMWEEPTLVALEDCRYDVAIEIDPDMPGVPEGEIGRFQFPAMTVAQVTIRGDLALEQRALDWIFGTWLPSSGYVPDDQPCFEVWHGRPFAHGYEYFEIDAHVPVKRTPR